MKEFKIGLYGGAFNPIHNGHLRVAEEVRVNCALEKVLFVPSYKSPLKKDVHADFKDRAEMLSIAIEGNPHFEISLCESSSEAPSYTVHMLDYLKGQYKGYELFLIIGLDAFMDMEKWYKPYEILSKSHLIVVTRGGIALDTIEKSAFVDISGVDSLKACDTFTIPLKSGGNATFCHVTSLEISSTRIRELLRERKSIKYLLPEKVESYIMSRGLYVF